MVYKWVESRADDKEILMAGKMDIVRIDEMVAGTADG